MGKLLVGFLKGEFLLMKGVKGGNERKGGERLGEKKVERMGVFLQEGE